MNPYNPLKKRELYKFFFKGKALWGIEGISLIKIIFLFVFFFGIKSANAQSGVDFSYSYFNITRNSGGGTLEPGDIIEVHALAFVEDGTVNLNNYYTDSIRAGTDYVPNSLRIITNEGVTVASYTDASGDDAGMYDPATKRLRINLGSASAPGGIASAANFASTTGGGNVTGGDIPVGGGGTLAIIAYRLSISATTNFGDAIYVSGNFYFSQKNGRRTRDYKYHYNYSGIKIVKNQGLCSDFSGASFTAESSFGSGSSQNRPTGVNAPGYTFVTIGSSRPNDNYYSIVNNTSADGYSASVFGGSWDIIGDHTGAANQAAGNSPVKPGVNGGYMLLVNAAIPTGTVYMDTIKNLCPNTYYEFSAWFRNICAACGVDMFGNRIRPNHGVLPNITFAVNGLDYYTTGNITYTNTWVKRGFIYKTGMSETSFIVSIKNNASGGDGNDWVLDDINLGTCYPNLIMNPKDTVKACAGYPILISDTVKSYFDNYKSYMWEASLDNGNTWIPLTSTINTGNPVLKNGLYVYHVDSVFTPTAADSGRLIRLKVATTVGNLSQPNCSVDRSQSVFLKIYSKGCSVLETQITDFEGTLSKNNATLFWQTKNEADIGDFEIEKSFDGVKFFSIGKKTPQNYPQGGHYIFKDPEPVYNIAYYRLKLNNKSGEIVKYSKIVVLYNKENPFKISVVNPFINSINVELSLPAEGKVEFNLCDIYGNIVNRKIMQLSKGDSKVILNDVVNLSTGLYILRTNYNGITLQNKLIKSKY